MESQFHINYLGLKAAFLTLQSFYNLLSGKHVRLLLDNSTGIACINHMGTSHSQSCNDITLVIWQWCVAHEVWLTAAHIPGKDNVAADKESRKLSLDAEWKIDSSVHSKAFSQLDIEPTTDLFASRSNKQLPCYISYRPDSEAYAIDAFSASGKGFHLYAFPPCSLIPRVLQKIRIDKCSGVLVAPLSGMRFFRQLSEFRLKGDWEKDSFCHFHAVFEAQL